MKTSINADGGYAKARASGKVGWGGNESDYDSLKQSILTSMTRCNAPTSGRLLEIGCGAGNLTHWFAENGYTAFGVDTTPKAIEWANDRNRQAVAIADFRLEDAAVLSSFEAGFFDLVIDGHCLHWIYGEGRRKILESVRRVLKPGGFLMICSQCSSSDSTPPGIGDQLTYDAARRVALNKSGEICGYFGTPESILAEVRDAGFKIVGSEVMHSTRADMLHLGAIRPRN